MPLKSVVYRLLIYKENSTNCYFSIYLLGWETLVSNFNYLSVIDYANGGVAAKIYSWRDYIDYLDRNRMLMDSIENARLRQQAVNQFISADQSVAEKYIIIVLKPIACHSTNS